MARERAATTAGWNWTVRRWVGVVMASCVAFAAFGVVRADAETRFAAPGGTGSAPCLRSDPCSLYLAASYEAPEAERVQPGDEVIVLPGEYSGARGDLGPEELVQITGKSTIHGEAGSPVPVIVSDQQGWVLTVASNESIASDLEIIAPNSTAPLLVSQSIAERMVVKTSAEGGIACSLGFRGVVRDSICISSGRKGAGAGERVHTNSFTEHTRTLRNVTAIGTGPESNGIRFDVSGGEIFANVMSSIARGTATDIEAIGEEPGSGPTVTVEASDYATANAVEKDGGTASVTAPGTGTNITAAPLLDEATFHQLPGSPTIDQGAVDSHSGLTDIDGDSRVIGKQADIGADEMTLPTTTGLTCLPTGLEFGQEVGCVVTVEAEGWGPPTGAVALTTSGDMELGECELAASGADQASCQVRAPVLAVSPGLQLTTAYRGDSSRAPSQGGSTISVSPAQTNLAIACAAATVNVGGLTRCTASVTNLGASLAPPTGEIHFDTSGPGVFSGMPSCFLSQISPGGASCQVAYKPIRVGTGSHVLEAGYEGDGGHDGATARLDLPIAARKGSGSAPSTLLKRKPAHRTSQRAAVFAFASGQAGAHFQCKLDSGHYRRCSPPVRLQVGRGKHVFRVRAIGETGVDPTPARFYWIVTKRRHQKPQARSLGT